MVQKPSFLLTRQDSNLDKQNQNLLCYRYTTGQFLILPADPPGFEPGQADPESAVLPLHHGSVAKNVWQNYKIKINSQIFDTKNFNY